MLCLVCFPAASLPLNPACRSVELAFQRVPGVVQTAVGFSQGGTAATTYELVCTGSTGHNEVVQVVYDPSEVSYEQLLDAFWAKHDPTTLNRQGGDVGTQYRCDAVSACGSTCV